MNTLKEFSQWLEEESRTPRFSIKKMKQIGSGGVSQESQVEMYQYLKKTLGESSWSGSFRYTWILDEQRVLKLIKSVDQVSQNQQELRNSECLGSEFAVQVFDYHPRFYWIIEERVEPLSEHQFIEQFNNKLGTKFKERTMLANDLDMDTILMITNVINHIVVGKERPSYQNIYPLFKRSNWFMGLAEKLRGCEVSSNDFHHENWGIRLGTGEFVLLDLGF
jgi:hypothetical protein